MNKREFTIGFGAGLLIASTLSMAGYLSFMANLGDENVSANTPGTTLEQKYTQSEAPAQSEAPQSADNSENAEAPLASASEPAQEPNKGVTKITPSSEPPKQTAEQPPAEETQEDKPEPSEPEDKPAPSEPEDKPAEAQAAEESEQERESEEPKPVTPPAQTPPPEQVSQPAETQKPAQTPQPTQTSQPTQTQKPAQTPQPAQTPPQHQAQSTPDEAVAVAVTIEPEASNAEIAAELSKSGVVGNAEEFAQYLDKVGLYNIKPESGTYELEKGKSYDEIIEEMTKGN